MHGNTKLKAQMKARDAAGRAEKEARLAMGLTSTMKKAIAGDSVLCTSCKATKLGPKTCDCKGGATKPNETYEQIPDLIAAANARYTLAKEAEKKGLSAVQAGKAAERKKIKEKQADNPYGDADVNIGQFAMDEEEEHATRRTIGFVVAKLGFTLERNCISKPNEPGSQAETLGVEVGWVVAKVNGKVVPADKKEIMKAVQAACKEGVLNFEFRIKNKPEAHYCPACNKFLLESEFFTDATELAKGPGLALCDPCVEAASFSAMF